MDDREGHGDPKQTCGACGLAQYCNKSCQREDWKVHKEVCNTCGGLQDLEAVRLWIDANIELL